MSAFVVDPAHIDYLVSAAIQWNYGGAIYFDLPEQSVRVDHGTADAVGATLLAENIASVNHRYPDDAYDDLPGPVPTPHAIDYRHRFALNVKPLWVLKAIRCYEYQSCEHPGWAESAAKTFCERMTTEAIARLPGYDQAPWDITSEHLGFARRVIA